MAQEADDPSLNGMDMDAAAKSLVGELGLGDESSDAGPATPLPTDEKELKPVDQPGTDKPVAAPVTDKPAEPVARAAPKSWPKDAHPMWSKLDAATQDLVEKREADFHSGIEGYKAKAAFAEQIEKVIAPYQPLLDSQGIKDHAEGVRGLLNAHYQLSSADEGQRTAFMAQLIKSYRIDPNKLVAAVGDQPNLTDPALKPLYDRIDALTGQVSADQNARTEAQRSALLQEVNAFASDPAHPFFEEVAPHIVLLLRDPSITLEEAYKQAVRANPLTWTKEEARIRTEVAADLKRQADEAAAKARKAKGTVISGRENERATPEVVGSMEDTMRETLAKIKTRVNS